MFSDITITVVRPVAYICFLQPSISSFNVIIASLISDKEKFDCLIVGCIKLLVRGSFISFLCLVLNKSLLLVPVEF